MLLEALNTDSLSYAGDKYQFKDVPVLLAPVQRPHPPLWYPGNFEYAARRGMNSVVGGPIPIQVQAMAKYHQLCELVRPGQPHPTVAGIHTIYIAPTDEEAQARMKQAWVAFTAHLTPLFRKWNLTPPKDPTVGGDVAAAMGAKLLLAGSPQTIREFVKQWADETGSDYFIGKFTVGDLTHDEVRRSIELFAEHVMPAVNG